MTAPRPASAQVEATLDAAGAVVKYDGFLSSSAASLTPSVQWRTPRITLAARGTLLAFESGNTSLQGLITAGAFSPALGPFRLEADGEAGASSYSSFAHFSHGLAELRAHLMSERWGLYAGPLVGRLASIGTSRGLSGVSLGGWAREGAAALELTWTSIALADTVFGDVRGRVRLLTGAFDVEAVAGLRSRSLGGTGSAYADVSGAVRLTPWLALVLSGGNYPSDPVRGTIPGGFFTAGFRLTASSPAAIAVVPQLAARPAPAGAGRPVPLAEARVAVEQIEGVSMLTVRAAAERVEVMGDFTDWKPVVLTRSVPGRFVCPTALPPGMLRFNVRLDGGAWGVPLGAVVAADDFGGAVGVLVVP